MLCWCGVGNVVSCGVRVCFGGVVLVMWYRVGESVLWWCGVGNVVPWCG